MMPSKSDKIKFMNIWCFTEEKFILFPSQQNEWGRKKNNEEAQLQNQFCVFCRYLSPLNDKVDAKKKN